MTSGNSTGVRGVGLAMLCAVSLALSGCATGDPTPQVRAFLATEPTATDALPADLEPERDDRSSRIDVDSSRLVGVESGVQYFVATSETAAVCLVLVAESPHLLGWTCGPVDRLAVSITGHGSARGAQGAARVVGVENETPDGWIRLDDCLIVNPDGSLSR